MFFEIERNARGALLEAHGMSTSTVCVSPTVIWPVVVAKKAVKARERVDEVVRDELRSGAGVRGRRPVERELRAYRRARADDPVDLGDVGRVDGPTLFLGNGGVGGVVDASVIGIDSVRSALNGLAVLATAAAQALCTSERTADIASREPSCAWNRLLT